MKLIFIFTYICKESVTKNVSKTNMSLTFFIYEIGCDKIHKNYSYYYNYLFDSIPLNFGIYTCDDSYLTYV